MNAYTDYRTAKNILGDGFIGVNEIKAFTPKRFSDDEYSGIQFSIRELEDNKDDYYLIPGIDRLKNGKPVTIRNMIEVFGKEPNRQEPCFYNQDWYSNEVFIDKPLNKKWLLIRKTVVEESRAADPDEMARHHMLPSAIECTYAFFIVWLLRGIVLWPHDFIWCSDTDHNGDRIYVGRYYDVDHINKNGFNIHRHLSIRSCYACIW